MKKNKLFKYLFLLSIIILVFGIYTIFKTDKLNYVALGDSLAEGMNPYGEIGYSYTDYFSDYLKENNKLRNFTKEYAKSSYKTSDLINDLNINANLKRELRESDLTTISIGANDLLNRINMSELDVKQILKLKNDVKEVIPSIENCIKEVRKYAKQDLIIIGYYNPIPFLFNTSGSDLDTLFAYIDDEYQKIAKKYDCLYISLYQLFKNNSNFLPNPSDIHPNLDGYEAISKEIIKYYIN